MLIYINTRGLRSLCSPAMYVAKSLLALRARRALRAVSNNGSFWVCCAPVILLWKRPRCRKSIDFVPYARLRLEWYTHAGRQAGRDNFKINNRIILASLVRPFKVSPNEDSFFLYRWWTLVRRIEPDSIFRMYSPTSVHYHCEWKGTVTEMTVPHTVS